MEKAKVDPSPFETFKSRLDAFPEDVLVKQKLLGSVNQSVNEVLWPVLFTASHLYVKGGLGLLCALIY